MKKHPVAVIINLILLLAIYSGNSYSTDATNSNLVQIQNGQTSAQRAHWNLAITPRKVVKGPQNSGCYGDQVTANFQTYFYLPGSVYIRIPVTTRYYVKSTAFFCNDEPTPAGAITPAFVYVFKYSGGAWTNISQTSSQATFTAGGQASYATAEFTGTLSVGDSLAAPVYFTTAYPAGPSMIFNSGQMDVYMCPYTDWLGVSKC